ncbi:MAG: hypothetical protein Q9219_005982 [cf. Caloplaca sp. 3 TL-2023]
MSVYLALNHMLRCALGLLIKLYESRQKRWRKNHFDLHTAIHEAEFSHVERPTNPKTKEPIAPAHKFEVYLEPDNYTEEKYSLFENYQRHVHKESPSEVTRSGFKRFLCSGLGQTSHQGNGLEQKLGSYHQCYRLDGRLVAIGVLDLLPGCVSSVYLLYHQDVKDWYFDPEVYSWDLLDEDYLVRLSARKYVSMSLERQLRLPPARLTDADELSLNSEECSRFRDYQQEEAENRGSRSSAFESRMPGLMSVDEVQYKICLRDWPLRFRNKLVRLEDLRGWRSWDIGDSSSIKGIIAELAAALGPRLVSQLVLELR